MLEKIWKDAVWSKVIATVIIAVGAFVISELWKMYNGALERAEASTAPVAAARPVPAIEPPLRLGQPIGPEALKHPTYSVGGDVITLQDGKREFNPGYDGIHERATFVHLVDHAFGDLNGDGVDDAIAVLQVTDGGTGIYYYFAPVISTAGGPRPTGKAYVLGDRLDFKSVSIDSGKVSAELMMHLETDGLCCPTWFRHLVFTYTKDGLKCNTQPCSELPGQP